MPSMNIYIPDSMKARMDAAGERANWSAVAQRAFAVELDHLESIKEIGSMTDVIERLKASKNAFLAQQLADGRASGTDWAKRHATWVELKRLAEADLDTYLDVEKEGAEAAWLAAACVFRYATGDLSCQPDRENLADFYYIDEEAVDAITVEFMSGFVEGARDVWEEVADKL